MKVCLNGRSFFKFYTCRSAIRACCGWDMSSKISIYRVSILKKMNFFYSYLIFIYEWDLFSAHKPFSSQTHIGLEKSILYLNCSKMNGQKGCSGFSQPWPNSVRWPSQRPDGVYRKKLNTN